MAEKRYYWLKLHRDFFKQKEIKRLRKIAGGDVFTIIYLKMLLQSLETDGYLYYEGYYDSFEEELADLIDEDTENVKVVIAFLISKGLLEEQDEDAYLLTKCSEMTGSESKSAERVRRFRANKQAEIVQALQCNGTMLQCNTDVTDCNTEKEKEKELELEKEKKSKSNADAFDQLWSLYPRKEGKKEAFEAFKRATKKGTTVEQIENGIKSYCEHIRKNNIEKQFIKQGSTYFRQEAWNDVYDDSPVTQSRKKSSYDISMLNIPEEIRNGAIEKEQRRRLNIPPEGKDPDYGYYNKQGEWVETSYSMKLIENSYLGADKKD